MTFTNRSWMWLAAGVAALMLTVPTLLAAQPRGGQERLRYDTATEAPVTGTVEAVDQTTGRGGGRRRRGLGGTHLTLKTGTETRSKPTLGPTAFLNEQKVVVAKGDTLEIVGSNVTVDGERVFIAKSVKKGSSVWTLRDASGLPSGEGAEAVSNKVSGARENAQANATVRRSRHRQLSQEHRTTGLCFHAGLERLDPAGKHPPHWLVVEAAHVTRDDAAPQHCSIWTSSDSMRGDGQAELAHPRSGL